MPSLLFIVSGDGGAIATLTWNEDNTWAGLCLPAYAGIVSGSVGCFGLQYLSPSDAGTTKTADAS